MHDLKSLVIMILTICLGFEQCFAYETETHPRITNEAIRLLVKEDACLDQNRLVDTLIEGSIMEDSGTRIFGHFDPLLFEAFVISPVLREPFLVNSCAAEAWGGIKGECLIMGTANEHTLPHALNPETYSPNLELLWQWEYMPNDLNLKHLGYVLHLLQDMSTPSHVRRDAHPPFDSDGDLFGDPFEVVGNEMPLLEVSDSDTLPDLDLAEIFENLRENTRLRHFSTDTCFDPTQTGPTSKYENHQYFYEGSDTSSRKIAHKGLRYWATYSSIYRYLLEDEGETILEADSKAREASKYKANINTTIAEEQFLEQSKVAALTTKHFMKMYFKKIAPLSSVMMIFSNEQSPTELYFWGDETVYSKLRSFGIPFSLYCASVAMNEPEVVTVRKGENYFIFNRNTEMFSQTSGSLTLYDPYLGVAKNDWINGIVHGRWGE